ncbi:MAG: hypothetical protein Ct9H300mP11_26730 [Chloroflexota bacterium]|nr:MAG: hypothetical protein Ct9H300mP11_26730 [Chloroflexota bacterium]
MERFWAALRQKDQTGEGQWVESALLDGQVAALSYHATGFMGTGVEPKRMGSGHPSLGPLPEFQLFERTVHYRLR